MFSGSSGDSKGADSFPFGSADAPHLSNSYTAGAELQCLKVWLVPGQDLLHTGGFLLGVCRGTILKPGSCLSPSCRDYSGLWPSAVSWVLEREGEAVTGAYSVGTWVMGWCGCVHEGGISISRDQNPSY